MKRLFRISKWIHKYIGLILILFLLWMSFSGILMNHPELIDGISVPRWLVPRQYPVQNWNRSSLIRLIYSRNNPRTAFAAGKQGIYISRDGGAHFSSLMAGLPLTRFYRKTNDLFLQEGSKAQLYAAMDGGLFVYNLDSGKWRQIKLGGGREKVVKIIRVKNRLLVFSDSHLYRSAADSLKLKFTRVDPERNARQTTISMVRLFFDVHDGSIWGLPGRLLYDMAGLILIFLSITAFYMWFYPRSRRKSVLRRKNISHPKQQLIFRLFYRYHFKLGIWFALILLVMGFTGFFMRPPLLALIAGKELPRDWYPGPLSGNPWEERIHNALYDAVEDKLIIQADDGFWSGPADLSRPFQKIQLNVPVFVMGATVFEPYGRGGYLVGSFSGLFHLKRSNGQAENLLTGEIARDFSTIRPADKMITGYFRTPQGDEFVTTHEQGLLPVGNAQRQGGFKMPPDIQHHYRMPLWNYCFELHNGRIFKDLIGGFYILLVPLGSLLFMLITLSGIIDWLYLKIRKKKHLKLKEGKK
ncbi:MAG: PepSY-associated TM helix domain-containing protein [Calditrichia bacterium]